MPETNKTVKLHTHKCFHHLKVHLNSCSNHQDGKKSELTSKKKKKTPKCLLTKQNKRLVYEQLFSPALSNQNLIFEPSSHIACLKPECTSCYWSNNYNIGLVANHNYYSQKVDK